jgi:hypothetical protein
MAFHLSQDLGGESQADPHLFDGDSVDLSDFPGHVFLADFESPALLNDLIRRLPAPARDL